MNFVPYGRHDLNSEDIESVVQVLKHGDLTQGPAIDLFEKSLCRYFNSSDVIAVSNGTAGLHVAYLAAGIQQGDAVIVPAITFAATSNAALYCGATPVFADVDPRSGLICPESVERCVKIANSAGLKVKAIVPVLYAGRPYEIDKIRNIAESIGAYIIEDACHALGSESRVSEIEPFTKTGNCSAVAMSIFSFHPVKHITTGEGGAISTNDPELSKRLRRLRTHGLTKNPSEFKNRERAFEKNQLNPWYMEMQDLGLNYRLADLQAILGHSQMKRLPAMIERRREIASIYDQKLSGLSKVHIPAGDFLNGRHSYHLYPLKINFKAVGQSREFIMNQLKANGIGSQVHYIPVPWHPYYESNKQKWLQDQLPGAAEFYNDELSIPMYSSLTSEDQERVIRNLISLFQ